MSEPKTPKSKLESSKAWKSRNAEKMKEWNRARNAAIRADPVAWAKKLEANRASAKRTREKRRKYDQERDPVKKAARVRLRHQIAKGKIKRLPCEVCGDPKSHGHHDDYSKPLDVRWLCSLHHKQHHDRNP